MSYKQLILETTKDIIGLKGRDVKLGHGSFITMGFGNDIEFSMTIRGKKETQSRAEWYLWIQHGDWELHLNESGQDMICRARDDRNKIAEAITLLEGLPLHQIKVLPSLTSTKFMFGEYGPLLIVHAHDWPKDEEAEDWMLFTAARKVLCVKYMNAWIERDDIE